LGDVVNLRQARKAKARAGREAEAAANRAAHGRTRAERNLTEARAEQDARRIDAHRLGRADVPPLPDGRGEGPDE
jgi:hypothetical protein